MEKGTTYKTGKLGLDIKYKFLDNTVTKISCRHH